MEEGGERGRNKWGVCEGWESAHNTHKHTYHIRQSPFPHLHRRMLHHPSLIFLFPVLLFFSLFFRRIPIGQKDLFVREDSACLLATAGEGKGFKTVGNPICPSATALATRITQKSTKTKKLTLVNGCQDDCLSYARSPVECSASAAAGTRRIVNSHAADRLLSALPRERKGNNSANKKKAACRTPTLTPPPRYLFFFKKRKMRVNVKPPSRTPPTQTEFQHIPRTANAKYTPLCTID